MGAISVTVNVDCREYELADVQKNVKIRSFLFMLHVIGHALDDLLQLFGADFFSPRPLWGRE